MFLTTSTLGSQFTAISCVEPFRDDIAERDMAAKPPKIMPINTNMPTIDALMLGRFIVVSSYDFGFGAWCQKAKSFCQRLLENG
ncbi:hypothetical protein [Pararhizobium sp. LjRoot238]|uniref:hypothetical protein n=1 Tax=Pararhizobium sp. LjRoot238 TaxID=3342293 RepID=UPI003ECDF8D0